MSFDNSLDRELPRYDAGQTYDWNYDHAPEPVVENVIPVAGNWTFCGIPVAAPLGVAAGPLLNGRWLLYYASLGFEILTYKTVRSRPRECYPLPNLQPVQTGMLLSGESDLPASERMEGSWAVSFGMPSKSPDEWRADVEKTRAKLATGKVLSVSVVGSVLPDWTLDDLAEDYAQCARWAIESGADCIETNFSCPNVSTCDGQLYQQPESAGLVAAKVRDVLGGKPLIVKVGHLTDAGEAEALLAALAPHVSAVAMTNSVAARVRDSRGDLLFGGERRGICGRATFDASLAQLKMCGEIVRRRGWRMKLIGVGGVSDAGHLRAYLDAGAESVHLATAAMIDPLCGLRILRGLIPQ